VIANFETSRLDAAHKALFRYLVKLAENPAQVSAGDIDKLREAGWSEEAIYDALTVASLFKFYNTWNNGAGVRTMRFSDSVLTAPDTAPLAAEFRFTKLPLEELPDHPPYKFVRQVHPSLSRISAWVSSLGASATLADLDGDGLANDLIHVDPRTDMVTIAPV